ncbi:MAG: DinB family protein [Balneolaceae bacterium]
MFDLKKLIEYTLWANDNWIQFLADTQTKEPKLWIRMSHIILAEGVWFDRIKGEKPGQDIWQQLSKTQLRQLYAVHEQIYRTLPDGNVSRIISYKKFNSKEYQSSVEDILMHLVLHGVHHRGQMAMIASSLELKPVNMDYITYCRAHDL